jgi:hypothetical protein
MDEGGILCLPRARNKAGTGTESEGSDRGSNGRSKDDETSESGDDSTAQVTENEVLVSEIVLERLNISEVKLERVHRRKPEIKNRSKTETKEPYSEEDSDSDGYESDGKATKSDNAEVKVRKWNARLARKLKRRLTPEMEAGMDVLRGFFLRRHKRRMTQSFLGWLHSQPKYRPCGIGMSLVVGLAPVVNPREAGPEAVYEWKELGRAIYVDWWNVRFKTLRKNILAGRDALERLSNTTWWDWEDGSRPLHWRWPRWYLEVIRDGLPVWFWEAPKQWRRPQPPGKTKAEHDAMVRKIGKVQDRRYILKGPIESLTSFFAVPKGLDDI